MNAENPFSKSEDTGFLVFYSFRAHNQFIAYVAPEGVCAIPDSIRVSSHRKRSILRKKRRQTQEQPTNLPSHLLNSANRQALHPETVLRMQQAAGNRRVRQLLEPEEGFIQRKPGDQKKIEAYLKEHPERFHLRKWFFNNPA